MKILNIKKEQKLTEIIRFGLKEYIGQLTEENLMNMKTQAMEMLDSIYSEYIFVPIYPLNYLTIKFNDCISYTPSKTLKSKE
jgi:hypothetical protein